MNIDIVSDVVCPWCYLGKRRLEKALEQAPQADLAIAWRPFRLNPDMPADGMDRRAYMRAKFGTDDVVKVHQRLVDFGREIGIPFAFERITRAPNTLHAHRLIRYAGQHGDQHAAVEGLFRGYFVEGRDIGDRDTLAEIGAASGLDRAAVAAYLASDEDAAAIRAEDEYARQIGIQGVPCFIINQQYALSGAQPPEAFLEVFEVARKGSDGDPSALV
jgi:predicted DsbA family dithiol-disulfide isomerase